MSLNRKQYPVTPCPVTPRFATDRIGLEKYFATQRCPHRPIQESSGQTSFPAVQRRPLVRETHYECQRDIQPGNIFVVEMADQAPYPLTSNGNGLIGHHLGADA